MVRKKTTILPVLPIIAFIPLILPVDESREVKEYIFRTQMDHRVCPICKQYENLVFQPEDTTIPTIPVHINCRCTMEILYVHPEEITEEMRRAAYVADFVERTKVPRQAIKIINQHYY